MLWFGAQAPHLPVPPGGPLIQWINLPPPPLPSRARPRAPTPPRSATPAFTPPPLVKVPTAPGAPPSQPSPPDAAPVPEPAGADVLSRARQDIGRIASALGKESPALFHAPLSTAQTRLAAGIDNATRAPRFYEAPRVELVQDQGGVDRRIYKVKGALGTYCVTVESNHAVDGLDQMKNGIHQKSMTCPREE